RVNRASWASGLAFSAPRPGPCKSRRRCRRRIPAFAGISTVAAAAGAVQHVAMLVGSFLASVLPRIACAALPRSCVLCGTRLAASGLCGGCLADLPRIADACPRCAVPVPALPPGVPCGACQRRPPPFAAARAVLEYAFPVDAALKALKFHRRLHYAPAFAALLAPAARESFP